MRDYIKELRMEREIIAKVFGYFTKKLNKKLRKNGGIISLQQMNQLIENALCQFSMDGKQRSAVITFFGIYTGAWAIVGREQAERVAYIVLADCSEY